MDTSSNHDLIGTTGLTISVVDYLLNSNEKRVVTTDVPPETWVVVVRKFIDECKPHLKYFHGFKEIGERIDGDWKDQIAFKFEGRTITFPEGMTRLKPA